MNKKLIAGCLMGLMVSQVSLARVDIEHLGRKALDVAGHLNNIAKANGQDLCAGDVRIAAAYVESAGHAMLRDKIDSASVSLVYAQNELKEISYNRSYCALLSSDVKSSLAGVILIKGELEAKKAANEPDGSFN
ncbi:MAG: hypothetical protein ACRC0B_02880 [Legionella sp.]